MDDFKFLRREKMSAPVRISQDCSLLVSYTDKNGVTREVLETPMGHDYTFDEIGIFEAVVDGKDALGGVLLGFRET